jgi:hypothetical protein
LFNGSIRSRCLRLRQSKIRFLELNSLQIRSPMALWSSMKKFRPGQKPRRP